MVDAYTILQCPICGDPDNLGTAELIWGWAQANFYMDGHGNRIIEYHGDTEMFWDTTLSTGVHCRSCDWGVDTAYADDGRVPVEVDDNMNELDTDTGDDDE